MKGGLFVIPICYACKHFDEIKILNPECNPLCKRARWIVLETSNCKKRWLSFLSSG